MFDGYGLSFNEKRVYERLKRGDATRDQLQDALYFDNEDPPLWGDTVVGVTIHRLKKKLKDRGLSINNGDPGKKKKAVYRLEKVV